MALSRPAAPKPRNVNMGKVPRFELGSKRMRKRDNAIFSQANFTFRYPVIPLDHSVFISSVSYTKGALSGVISNSAAYNYAKGQWKGAGKIIFITSVDGCGEDHANDLFLSQSITFNDTTKAFTAKGSTTEYGDVYESFKLDFGKIGTLNVRWAIDKRAMFEPHKLEKRVSKTWSYEWSQYRNNEELLGTDEDAPWPNAAKLIAWGSEGGEEDDSYKKGEVADPNGHHKRWDNATLPERDLSYGLILYCVECGFGGKASLTGTIEASLIHGITKAQIQFNAQFKAGLNLGLEAFVTYEKEWTYPVAEFSPWNFGIPLLCTVGPYIGLDVQAGITIEATGTLLIGASVEWENIDILIDLLDSSNSHSNGLTPVLTHRTEATGELKMEASLGLPASVGVKLNVLKGLWAAKGGVVDTPSVVLEGSFEVSATVTDDGEIVTDVDGDCYGIAWNIHFENTLEAFITLGDDTNEFPLIDPMESDPIAEGCIGYVNDGTGDDGSDDEGGMSGTGMDCGGSGLFADCNGSQPAPVSDPTSKKKTGKKTDTKSTKQKGTAQSKSSSSDKKASSNKKPKTSTTSKKPTSTKTKKPTKTSSVITATTKNTKATQAAAKKVSAAKSSATSKKAAAACTPSAVANSKAPPRSVCKRNVVKARVPSKSIIGTASSVKSVNTCAETCLKSKQCLSFGYGDDKTCQLYGKNLKSLGVTSVNVQTSMVDFEDGLRGTGSKPQIA
ncbi:uncharacterized protein FTJAE_2188 [Fusarium tjaetaba]|uniref:Apple domain-containing protein n=1 Tax=Fusarium tjaetaba TaxID=1567544 RepID=A0A8H5W5V8_9HYPO|nr:uncharacterized protein FTJAE_2188 [Fusarium tjaetaba]KAF5646099.1 hypothetical protein FTJAE_2188 [Fusarium tjaetaba]